MDPITFAGMYATIVGLIGNYRSEIKGQESDSYNNFIEWLGNHRHEEIKTLIESNQSTTISVKALLSQKSELFLSRLDQLDRILATISTKIDGLDSLAESIHPTNKLSKQAIRILSELNASGKSNFYISRSGDGEPVIDFRGTGILCEEPRFMEADIESLVSVGFLTPRHNSTLEYHLTRIGSEYLTILEN